MGKSASCCIIVILFAASCQRVFAQVGEAPDSAPAIKSVFQRQFDAVKLFSSDQVPFFSESRIRTFPPLDFSQWKKLMDVSAQRSLSNSDAMQRSAAFKWASDIAKSPAGGSLPRSDSSPRDFGFSQRPGITNLFQSGARLRVNDAAGRRWNLFSGSEKNVFSSELQRITGSVKELDISAPRE